MTERCEPPPEWRDRDGWHWVKGLYSTGPMLWRHFTGGFWQTDGELDQVSPEQAHDMALEYLAPATPPATVVALVEALEAANQFIQNGIELGFIRMPDAGTPDPALKTPAKIETALALYRAAAKE